MNSNGILVAPENLPVMVLINDKRNQHIFRIFGILAHTAS